MSKNVKSFIAKLLVLCMVVGLLPVVALAAGTAGNDDPYKPIGSDTDIYHVSGDVYALRNDVTLSGAYQIESKTTLRLNDHYLIIPDTATIRVSAPLTIEGPGSIGTTVAKTVSQKVAKMLRAATGASQTTYAASFFVDDGTELSLSNVADATFDLAGTGTVKLLDKTTATITVKPDEKGEIPTIVADTGSSVEAKTDEHHVAVTFNANEGEWTETDGTKLGTKVVTAELKDGSATITFPDDPTRSNYTFAGWFDAENGGNQVTSDKSFEADTTLYAHWNSTGGSTGGGGGSSTGSSSTVNSGKTTNGSFTISDKNAKSGDTVKITPKADKGYVVDQVTVKDKSGNAVDVTKNSDGTYSFVMPEKKLLPVTVNVTFSEITFTDVPADTWYTEAVKYVTENGLMLGVGDGKFAPDMVTSRAMVVTVLYRIEGEPDAGDGEEFTDVAADQWYADAVAWASANGIVGGYGNGKFGPADAMTREQLAAVMYRYAEYKGFVSEVSGDLSGYTDADQISSWALDAMKWATGTELITGTSETTLSPSGSSTRSQLAVILMRYCENIMK